MVLKVGVLPDVAAAEIAALHTWSGTGLLPLPLRGDKAADVALALSSSIIWMTFVPGSPVGSRSALSAAQVYRLTDAVCDIWCNWQISPVASAAERTIGGLETVYSRRVVWARRRCDSEVTRRHYWSYLDGLVEQVMKLDAEVKNGLCHGDLSPRNLLVEPGTGEVHVIDPTPGIVDPLADLAHWAVNSNADLSGQLTEAVLTRIAARADVDVERLRTWAQIAAITESNLAPSARNAATGWLDHCHFV